MTRLSGIKSKLLLFHILLFLTISTWGKSKPDTIQPTDVLYISTDKNIYTPNETIWFVGHLIEHISKQTNADVLSIALLNEENPNMRVQKDFVLDKNMCLGSFTIPDTLISGNYRLIGYTNILNSKKKPIHYFQTSLRILKPVNDIVDINLTIMSNSNKDSTFIATKVYFPESIPVKDKHNAEIKYHIGNGKQKTSKLNVIGDAILSFSTSEIQQSDLILQVDVLTGRKTHSKTVKIEGFPQENTAVTFYPEKNAWSDKLLSRIVWTVSPTWDKKNQYSAIIFEDNIAIDTVYTDRNRTGIFSLNPIIGKIYTLQLLGNDKTYIIPNANNNDVAIKLENNVAQDTLMVIVASPRNEQFYFSITNNYTGKINDLEVPIPIQNKKRVLIDLSETPKGINTLHIYNQEKKLVASRTFFAHYNRRNTVHIETDKERYSSRDSVNFSISVLDSQDKPLTALVSLSCIHKSRIDSSMYHNDIESFYFAHTVNEDIKSHHLYYSDEFELEKQLIIYDLTEPKDNHANEGIEKKRLSGKITNTSKKDNPMLIIIKNSSWDISEIPESGAFEFDPQQIAIRENENMHVFLQQKKMPITFPVVVMDHDYAASLALFADTISQKLSFNHTGNTKNRIEEKMQLDLTQNIETVVISKKTNIHTYGYGANACGDWVCQNNILNCPNHPPNGFGSRKPIPGERYKNQYGTTVTYKNCVDDYKVIKPIYTSRVFKGMDNLSETTQNVAQYMSTIYWNPSDIILREEEKKRFKMITSDLKGEFIIRVQGVADNGDFFYGEKSIRVQ